MEQIFAPWRIKWVEQDDAGRNAGLDGCVFCELPNHSDDDDVRILAQTEHAYILLNNSPYNPGHLMIIPFEHTPTLHDLPSAAYTEFAQLQQTASRLLDAAFRPQGFNVGMNIGSAGGASVPDHVHAHVVPRWDSDTGFMPVTADLTVIAESLDATYTRLSKELRELDGVSIESRPDLPHLFISC
ncbi:HIT family protein [Halorarius halobius]|uniref:HIT family protein n=1 Tax=Halorarius halobius TaxID=2962671 RepID=UPI0020CC165F|nr:HIT domain-containing protein [Halorarius halobius]